MKDLKTERLKRIIAQKSFKYNKEHPFKLVSGKQSPFYFDCKKTTLDPEGSYLIGEIIFRIVRNCPVKRVAGLTLGADPIASALMHRSWSYRKPISHLIIRKQKKDHGSVKWIEGNFEKGDQTLIVDDVITTGSSVITSVKRAMEEGLNICGVIILLDRQEENGMENVRKFVQNKPVISLVTKDDIISFLQTF